MLLLDASSKRKVFIPSPSSASDAHLQVSYQEYNLSHDQQVYAEDLDSQKEDHYALKYLVQEEHSEQAWENVLKDCTVAQHLLFASFHMRKTLEFQIYVQVLAFAEPAAFLEASAPTPELQVQKNSSTKKQE